MRSTIVLIVVASYLAGCTSWKPQTPVPQHAAQLRVSLTDGRRVPLYDAERVTDSLVGFDAHHRPGQSGVDTRTRIAIAVSDVERAEVQHFDAARTALLVGGIGAVAAGIIVALGNYQTAN